MGKIFRDGARLGEKIVIISLLVSSIFTIYSFITSALINNDLFIKLVIGSLIYSLIIIGMYLRVFFKKDSGLSQSIRDNGKNPLTVIIALVFVMPLLHVPAISKGIPAAIHHIVAKEAEQIVTVKKSAGSYSSKYCDGGVYVKEYDYFFNNEICGLARDDWKSLEKGSRILLIGEKSSLGFSYDRYSVSHYIEAEY